MKSLELDIPIVLRLRGLKDSQRKYWPVKVGFWYFQSYIKILYHQQDFCLSFSELSTSSLSSLDPYSDYVGVNISLNNSSSLSFLNVYAPSVRFSLTDGRTDSFSPSILPSSRNLFILGDFNCHHSLWDSRGAFTPRGKEVLDWVISSDLTPLNNPDIPTLLHCSSGSRSSPDISFAHSSRILSCTREVLQDLGSNRLPIFLSVPLSPVFCPNKRPPSFNFQKAR